MTDARFVSLEAARTMLELSLYQLWVDYFGLGGSLLPVDIEAFLSGQREIGNHDHDLLVQALNEHYLERGQDHPLSYADEVTDPDS